MRVRNIYAQCLLLIKWLKFKKNENTKSVHKQIYTIFGNKKKARIKKAKRVHVTRWWGV